MLLEFIRHAILGFIALIYITLCAVAVTVACSSKDGPAFRLVGLAFGFLLLLVGVAFVQVGK